MMRAAAALCLAAACHSVAVAVQSAPPLQSVEYRSHFEPNPGASPTSGSRDGWESFPLSQEAGYDPSIQPETSSGKSVLVRELAPTRDGFFQLGFIRRMHMVSGDHAKLTLRLQAPYLTHPTAAHISIFRGEAEERHDLTLNSSAWQDLSVALAASPKPITAIAFAVDFPSAIHTRPERLLLTDVRLEALGTRRIDISAPAALWDPTRELYYLQRSLTPGSELTLRTATASHWTLLTPANTIASEGTADNIRYRLPATAQPGIWTLHLATATASTTALLLARPAQPVGLIFDHAPAITPDLLTSIRARKAQLEKITLAETGSNIAVMDPHYLLPGLPSYFAVLLQPTELAMLAAMEYRATADPRALAQSRALLASIARWPMWVHPWFAAHGYHSYYPVGLATKYVVMAEEFLGADLPAADRAALDHSLMELCAKPIYEEYVLEDRLQFNTSNWIGNTVGGALLAALQSSDPSAAGYALGLFIKQRDHVNAAYTSDGSYGEGITYHRFDLETTELTAAAAKRLLGTSIDTPLLNGDRYMRYAAYGVTGLMDYGDSHVDLPPSNVFAYVAALNKSDALTDFYFKYRDTGTAQILPRVLWESQIKPAAAPTPDPTSTVFPERGIAILREGWSPESTVIAMRAGKNFNHNHADEGSIFYAHNGTLWLGEAGYADYYKDPFYPTFNIQAIGHNTLLVDGNPESQVIPGNEVFGKAPSITHAVLGNEVSLVQSDLTTAYGGVLDVYTRSLVHLPGGIVVVIDDVASRTPHTFTQLWHPQHDFASFDRERNTFTLTDGKTQLDMHSFATDTVTLTKQISPLPLTSYDRAEHTPIEAPVQVEVSTVHEATAQTILTVIAPHALNQSSPGVRWTKDHEANVLSIGAATVRIHSHEISVAWSAGALLINGTHLEGPDEVIDANHPVDLGLTYNRDGAIDLEVTAAEPTTLTFQHLVSEEGNTTQHVATGKTMLRLKRIH